MLDAKPETLPRHCLLASGSPAPKQGLGFRDTRICFAIHASCFRQASVADAAFTRGVIPSKTLQCPVGLIGPGP